jgi:hypothetical protein
MQRIDADTVHFDKNFESEAAGEFDDHLNSGLSVVQAVDEVRKKYGNDLSEEFYKYLADE